MVLLGRILFAVKRTFIDGLRVYVRGGTGGQGYPSLGGIGGRGGDVYFESTEKIESMRQVKLSNPSKRYIAGHGKHSSLKSLQGSNGTDSIVQVPLGVSLVTDDGEIIGDLNKNGQRVKAAKGGGGAGPHNQFTPFKGQRRTLKLDLKMIADIGLVGFPNAGKSTFLAAISRASPKIAAYPFTTITPQIGTMEYSDLRKVTLADLPGLIEGAHVNIGMGHKFLKHVERTTILLFVVDIMGFQLSNKYKYRNAFETILLLNKELELYKPELLEKPAILALNKLDIDGSEDIADQIKNTINSGDVPNNIPEVFIPENRIKFENIFTISAKEQKGTEEVKNFLRYTLDEIAEDERDLNTSRNHQE